MPKLILLHGFLGDPSDWDKVISLLPDFECEALSYPFVIPQEGILVGYSMGGRIASSYPHPKILISSHVGLVTKQEKLERKIWENKWHDVLTTQGLSTFLQQWYEQPLFSLLKKSPNFPAIFQRRLKVNPTTALHQLETHSLATHSFCIPKNATFLCGAQDLKYTSLYTQLSLNPLFVEESSHACHLEKPERCANLIRLCVERMRNIPGHQVPQR